MCKKLDGLKLAKQIANERGGECISEEYFNIETKMHWKCKEKHQWFATLHNIIGKNSWCHKCANKQRSEKQRLINGLSIAQEIAKKHGGRCLSNEYINSCAKIYLECKNKHTWYARLNDIQYGKWCKKCAYIENGERHKISGLSIAQEIAKKHGGRCLSNEYINSCVKMKWRCKLLHIWHATLSSIKSSDSWCPECGYLKSAKSQTNSTILKHWKTDKDLVCQASWEKAVVNYLNNNKINFRWQSKTFKTPFLKLNGENRTYRPDLYLFSTKQWIEIKGYFRKDAQEKWDWFHKEHPNSELWNKKKLKEMGLI